ncbi:MAG: DNA-binding response regulator [Firmicutes bacterium HGW-Firmicutes-8]|nr:MAG: DNA-binding response regulator [Firmicutes bacterium HGW-Firmicutes-8]
MPKILVVDDERHIVELIRFNLIKEGWSIDTAFDGRTALNQAATKKPDLIVLDIMLPEVDGFEVCRLLRANRDTSSIPIIMLSAKTEELDKILGLEIGADDYMTKPFSPRELVARIKARLREKNYENKIIVRRESLIKVGHVSLDPENFEAWVNGVKNSFTLKEFELLRLLITNPGRVFTREFLLEMVWGYEYSHDTRTVDVHIRHLRQKIEDDSSNPKYIETIRGVGYRYREQNSVQ